MASILWMVLGLLAAAVIAIFLICGIVLIIAITIDVIRDLFF